MGVFLWGQKLCTVRRICSLVTGIFSTKNTARQTEHFKHTSRYLYRIPTTGRTKSVGIFQELPSGQDHSNDRYEHEKKTQAIGCGILNNINYFVFSIKHFVHEAFFRW
jgi:hypothetical protein